MLEHLIGYLLCVGIVIGECGIILLLALPYSRFYNRDGRRRLIGHFDTSPPRGYPAVP